MTRGYFKYLVLVVFIFIAGAGLWGWSILSRGFSARDQPGSVEAFLARRFRRMGVPRAARDAKNPVTASPEVLSSAMEHFADHCAICHANDGSGNTMIGKGLFPKPPDMRLEETQSLTDGELYYIVENGIRFTGMPAFGEEPASPSDEESWALVAFIRQLPKLTVEETEAMKKMNPKSPGELEKEERIRKFLAGEDVPNHHH